MRASLAVLEEDDVDVGGLSLGDADPALGAATPGGVAGAAAEASGPAAPGPVPLAAVSLVDAPVALQALGLRARAAAHGLTALHVAAFANDPRIVRALLGHRVPPYACDSVCPALSLSSHAPTSLPLQFLTMLTSGWPHSGRPLPRVAH
jgi:hypothetical protein